MEHTNQIYEKLKSVDIQSLDIKKINALINHIFATRITNSCCGSVESTIKHCDHYEHIKDILIMFSRFINDEDNNNISCQSYKKYILCRLLHIANPIVKSLILAFIDADA